jgi:hypothetical protein
MISHRHHRKSRKAAMFLAGTALAAMVPVAMLQPAHAATYSFSDPAGDIASGADIQRVRVDNGRPVVVKVFHRDLRRAALPGVAVYLDTNRSRSGPEYLLNINRYEWYMWRTRGWTAVGDAPLSRPFTGRLDYDRDVTTARIPRRSLGYPGRIRVNVTAHNSGSARDHAPSYHTFSRWVSRG